MSSRKKAKRYQIHVVFNKKEKMWQTEVEGSDTLLWSTKKAAVRDGAEFAKDSLKYDGRHSELYIHGRNGKIQDKRTYGADPSGTKG